MRVALTLAPGSLPELAPLLRSSGFDPVSVPLLRTEECCDAAGLIPWLRQAGRFGALVVTSPRAAGILARALLLAGTPRPRLPAIWAVGAASAAPVRQAGYRVRLPREQTPAAAALAAALLESGLAGPVLHLCGDPHRATLAAALREKGHPVMELVVYRAVLAGPEQARAALAGSGIVVAGSHRVVELLAQVSPRPARPGLVALGPGVAATARRLGWETVRAARAPTAEGVVEACLGLGPSCPRVSPPPARPQPP